MTVQAHDPASASSAPNPFPAGVSSGDVDQHGAVLWAQVAALGTVRIEWSTRANFSRIAGSAEIAATDPAVPVKLAVEGLHAGTQYYFRVTDADGRCQVGRFATAAELGRHEGFSMGVAGDWRGELAPYPAISNAAAAGLDLFVKHGDTIYADYPSPAVPAEQATTLAEYRAKHAEVYAVGTFWSALQATTPILSTIDDHEVINDFSGGEPAANDPRVGADTGLVNDSPLFETGLQVFQEYNAIEDRYWTGTGDARTEGERDLYRYTTQGSDAATYVLDARSFRDAPVAAWNGTGPDAVRFLTQAAAPDRTLLGDPQLARLKADLLDAEAKGVLWKFVMVPEPIQNFGPLAAGDRYEGYAAERAELLAFIDQAGIENVVFVSADVHGTVVNNLTYQLSAGGPQIALPAFEITTGSVAFDDPFGPAALGVAQTAGLITPQQAAFYGSLPVANDADSIPNDKDDFFKLVTDGVLAQFGYDPIGLNNNLVQADGLLDANLLQGDYVAVHTFGWTRFDVDQRTGDLTVTTYGIPPYGPESGPRPAVPPVPQVVSQFTVEATRSLSVSFWQDGVPAGLPSGVTPPPAWTRPVLNLHYDDARAADQDSASLTDSTGLSAGRFLASAGDVSIERADFAGGGSRSGLGTAPLMTLDWIDSDTARLVHEARWSTIRNVRIDDFSGDKLTVDGFVDVRAALDTGRDQILAIFGAKRGAVELGAGDDFLRIAVDSEIQARTGFAVDMGEGDDAVRFEASARDYTALVPGNQAYQAAWTRNTVELGEGDDRFVGGRSIDTLVYRGDRSDFAISVSGDRTRIEDLSGEEGTDILWGANFLRFGNGEILGWTGSGWALL